MTRSWPNQRDIAPLAAQQLANSECAAWGREWAADEVWTEPEWAINAADAPPPQILLQSFKQVLATFPCGTGLGWDDCHPTALLRLSDEVLMALIDLLSMCEGLGRWPEAVKLVVVVLLAKPGGGFRPIGLIPLLPRIWMRARREVAQKWEEQQSRSYLYAGEARGATVTAWKQAARAELAASAGTDYGQVLLDLVKAFERIPHWILVREAKKLGYPIWMVRLAIATYRLQRVLRVGSAVSDTIRATRGITLALAWQPQRCDWS